VETPLCHETDFLQVNIRYLSFCRFHSRLISCHAFKPLPDVSEGLRDMQDFRSDMQDRFSDMQDFRSDMQDRFSDM
jgi:hypothetical protein